MLWNVENVFGVGSRGRRMLPLTLAVVTLMSLGTAALDAESGGLHYPRWQQATSVDPGGRLGINTVALEGCPIESPDGYMMFFASDRAGSRGIDIWVAYRQSPNQPWGEPAVLPDLINSASNDFCPTPLPGGRLLFVSNRPNECGGGTDIYQARLDPARGWLPPRNLGCEVNSAGNEFSPSLIETADRTVLYFSSDRFGGIHDIYSSTLQIDGSWSPAVPIEELNSAFDDARPNVRSDGLEIVFDSNRSAGAPEIWSAVRPSVCHRWSEPVRLGGTVNSDAAETRPSLSWDGRRLYFGSNRADGEGNSDIYVATRSHNGIGTPQASTARCDDGTQR
jgi:Tol biopolymer transport system component